MKGRLIRVRVLNILILLLLSAYREFREVFPHKVNVFPASTYPRPCHSASCLPKDTTIAQK